MQKPFSVKNQILFIVLSIISLYCCSETDTLPPTVTTSPISDKTSISATSGGEVIDNGGSKIIKRGVSWSDSVNPTIADYKTSDGIGLGSFTSSLTDLSENTIYYYRAYATNENGTVYGEEFSFLTGIGVLDQEQANHTYGFAVGDNLQRWQTFKPTLRNTSTLEIYVATRNPTGNCTVYLQSEDGSVTYATQSFGTISLTMSGWIQLEIIPPLPALPDTKYRIGISRSISHTPENAIYWIGNAESDYPGYCDPDPDSIPSHWDNFDYAFRTYGY